MILKIWLIVKTNVLVEEEKEIKKKKNLWLFEVPKTQGVCSHFLDHGNGVS